MPNTAEGQNGLLERQPWMTFLLPFLVYMVAGSLEPSPGGSAAGFASYPVAYAIKIALTLAAVAFVWPGYRQFPLRLSPLALLVGVVGGPIWIGLAMPGWERLYVWPFVQKIGLGFLAGGDRPGFNPFDPSCNLPAAWAWSFLAVRFLGLVAVVPLIEEFFLRGFVMRFVMQRDWWNVPFGHASRLAIVLGTVVPMLSHPELLAAAVWFSMMTWLMLRTRNIWDCVAAHAITNLILGVYVVMRGGEAWQLL
jgi:uncharacterized protein